MINRLHHINFLVRDLPAASAKFSTLLGLEEPPVEELVQRGVRLVRFPLGETWLILVEPVDPDGFPAQYLEEHGEGFFLASFQVPDVQQAANELSAAGLPVRDQAPRQGLDDWQVMDFEASFFNGIELQLVQSDREDRED